jgi:tetratricopeptide (TPR) repeat protein
VNTLLSRWPLVARAGQLETLTGLLTRRDRAGALIFGPAGVGKTRLAAECRHVADTDGHPTEWIVGSYATQTLPLAAVAAFVRFGGLPGTGQRSGRDAVEGFERVHEALTERYGGRRVVVIADDMHRLDAASLALLFHLMAMRAIMVVGTVRTGDPVPDLVTSLWRDEQMVRLDLADLTRDDFDTLLHLALGGPIEASAQFRLWSVSKGNPLYVHELVMGALEHGTLVEREGVWHLQGRLRHTERLGDLVAERMGHLDPSAYALLEVLSLYQVLPLDYVSDLVDAETLAMLEGSGRIKVSDDRRDVTLGHPLFGEFLRRRMPSVRARELFRREAERLEAQGGLSPAEQLQVAHFRLAADGRADPVVLLEAARVARLAKDFRSVRRLIEAIPAQDRGPDSRLLLGEALYELGSCVEAEGTLAGLGWEGVDDGLLLRIILTRTNNLQWGLGDASAASELNAEGRRHFRSQPALDALWANEAAIHLLSGRVDRALEVLEDPAQEDTTTSGLRAAVLAPVLALAGRTNEAVTLAAMPYGSDGEVDADIASSQVGLHRWNRVFALTEAGRLADASSLARAGAEKAARDGVPKAQIWFALHQGRIALIEGQIATARRCFAEAAGLALTHPFAGPLRIALAGLAAASAMLGDITAAVAALGRRDELSSVRLRGAGAAAGQGVGPGPRRPKGGRRKALPRSRRRRRHHRASDDGGMDPPRPAESLRA